MYIAVNHNWSAKEYIGHHLYFQYLAMQISVNNSKWYDSSYMSVSHTFKPILKKYVSHYVHTYVFISSYVSFNGISPVTWKKTLQVNELL